MAKKQQLDLTQGNITKVLITFILPILAGSLLQQLYTMVDAVVVGQFLGKTGIAAVDSVQTLFKFPINFMNGMAAGATIMISAFFGQKNDRELDCAIHTAFSLALILGVICSIAGVALTPQLLNIMSVPEEVRSMTLAYTRIYFAGIWCMTLYNMLAGVLRAFGDSKSPFYILIVCCVVNVAGDLLLVGVFHCGVQGAAIATVLAQVISAVCALHVLSKSHDQCTEPVWKLHICKEHMLKMLKIGFPLALQSILFPIANSIVQASVNTMGTDCIAAWSVGGKLDMFIWLIADSMSPALSTYTAQNIGACRQDRVKKGTLSGAGMSAGIVALISVALYFGSGIFGRWFVNAQDAPVIVPLVAKYMKMMAPFYFFYALGEAFTGSCCGMGDTFRPMVTTLVCTCLLRVLCIWFIMPRYNTMECIICIYIASWIATGIAFTVMFFIKSHRLCSCGEGRENHAK